MTAATETSAKAIGGAVAHLAIDMACRRAAGGTVTAGDQFARVERRLDRGLYHRAGDGSRQSGSPRRASGIDGLDACVQHPHGDGHVTRLVAMQAPLTPITPS